MRAEVKAAMEVGDTSIQIDGDDKTLQRKTKIPCRI